MSNVSISTALKMISNIKDKKERVEALKQNGVEPVKAILNGIFNPNIKFLLPEGSPPYTPSVHENPTALFKSTRTFFHFVEGGSNITQVQRERIFLQLLESIEAGDAELLLAMKDKKSPYPGLTKDIVLAAFPELFPT